MKLWQGRFKEEADPVFEKMNRSLPLDAVLLDVDILASRAHARALLQCGVLTPQEWQSIETGLQEILTEYTPDQVRAIAQAGHEIVAHGYAQDLIPAKLSDTDDERYTRATTELITRVTGQAPAGWISPRATASHSTNNTSKR